MEQSAVSHQLKLLRDNRLVKARRDGKAMLYSLDDQHVLDVLEQTFRHVTHQ
jgi:DNA-binding transcriptional ArsR family regulator